MTNHINITFCFLKLVSIFVVILKSVFIYQSLAFISLICNCFHFVLHLYGLYVCCIVILVLVFFKLHLTSCLILCTAALYVNRHFYTINCLLLCFCIIIINDLIIHVFFGA